MLSGCILLTHVHVMGEDVKGALGPELLARRARVVCGKAFDFSKYEGLELKRLPTLGRVFYVEKRLSGFVVCSL